VEKRERWKSWEFGDISKNEYHELMEQFLADDSPGIKQTKVGKILSFYKVLPEFVVDDPFTDAVNYALEKIKLSKSEVKYKC